MVKLILLATISTVTLADEVLSPAVVNISQRFPQNKKILQECLYQHPSKNKSLGCTDAYQYMIALCKASHEDDASKKYKNIAATYFNQACKLFDRSENQTARFFELDEKGCIYGYETIPDRIITLNKNKELLDEQFIYTYEKNSCKSFRTYVNLCAYVDGDLKEVFPKDYQKLPKLDFQAAQVCSPGKFGANGIYTLNLDLSFLMTNPNNKIFETLISNYRSRMPSSQGNKLLVCDQIRSSYNNLGCAQYENVKDGDPLYISQDEMQKKRLKANETAAQGTGR